MNQDNYYPIEIKICSKNGWSTPQEAGSIWRTPYAREGVTIHWWGDGTGASNHDNIVNYFLGQANAGVKSVNYVVSDNKITLMVSPDNVAWCSNNGNPTTISIEHQPTLNGEGYKKSGWLLWQLEGRYGRRLSVYPHNKWVGTACPGSIDLGRIRAEADKWAAGGYLPPKPVEPPKPAPTPTPPASPTISISYSKQPQPVEYVLNKDTELWNFNSATWAGFKSVKPLKKGEKFTVYAIADNHNVKAKYGVTEYSFNRGITNGVNMADLDLVLAPAPPAQPDPPAPTLPPTVPVPPPIQVDPPTPGKDKEQDERLNALEKIVKAVVDFLKSIFSGFKV